MAGPEAKVNPDFDPYGEPRTHYLRDALGMARIGEVFPVNPIPWPGRAIWSDIDQIAINRTIREEFERVAREARPLTERSIEGWDRLRRNIALDGIREEIRRRFPPRRRRCKTAMVRLKYLRERLKELEGG